MTWIFLKQVTAFLPPTSADRRSSPIHSNSHGSSISLRLNLFLKDEKRRFRRLHVSCSRSDDSRPRVFGGSSSPYDVLGVDSTSSLADIKVAFRSKVKMFHPDLYKNSASSDAKIRQVIEAYELLMLTHKSDSTGRECIDPFQVPECAANDLFVNEAYCIGKGCHRSCVEKAPYAFSFNIIYGSAHAISQSCGEDYKVRLAISECPRKCIHCVTPSQRIILEELLQSVFHCPVNSAELGMLDSLIIKANFENNRYEQPK